jgi:hypothetical protein
MVEKKIETDDELRRFICVFFINKDIRDLNKNYKKVKVIEAKESSLVRNILINEHSMTFIKSIRDLDYDKYYLYDENINKKEEENNKRLKKI